MSEADFRAAFDRFDADGSGVISARELVGLLEELYSHEDDPHAKAVSVAADLLKESDKDEDGQITWEEFKKTMSM